MSTPSEQARARNYQDFLIVDVDSHHYENEHYTEVFEYIESPVIRREAMDRAAPRPHRHAQLARSAIRTLGGRIHRSKFRGMEKGRRPASTATSRMTLDWMDAMGVDYSCLFPTPMLFLGLHPQVEIEVAMCRAYNALALRAHSGATSRASSRCSTCRSTIRRPPTRR